MATATYRDDDRFVAEGEAVDDDGGGTGVRRLGDLLHGTT